MEASFSGILGILLPLTRWKEKNDALPGLWTVHVGREGVETAASGRSILLCFRLRAEVLATKAIQGHQRCQGTSPLIQLSSATAHATMIWKLGCI